MERKELLRKIEEKLATAEEIRKEDQACALLFENAKAEDDKKAASKYKGKRARLAQKYVKTVDEAENCVKEYIKELSGFGDGIAEIILVHARSEVAIADDAEKFVYVAEHLASFAETLADYLP